MLLTLLRQSNCVVRKIDIEFDDTVPLNLLTELDDLLDESKARLAARKAGRVVHSSPRSQARTRGSC